MTAPPDATGLAKRPPLIADLIARLRAHALHDECSVRSWGEEPTDISGDLHAAADELDRLATVEAERGEYLTQARIAEQMRQTATVERDAAYALQVKAFEQFEAERARAVCAEAHRDRCAAVLLQREAEIVELDTEVTRLARGHDEYNRVNQLLTEENDRLRAVAAAARTYVAARAPLTEAAPMTRVDARRHIKRAYGALVAVCEAKS